MKGHIKALLGILVVLSLLSGFGCSSKVEEEPMMGNTSANLSNGGMSVRQGDWIYFMNYEDQNSLYRMKTDGSGSEKVSGDMAYYLNAGEDWLYFCNGSEGNTLFRVKTDGQERQQLGKDIAANVLLVGNKLYYINFSDPENQEEIGRIFRMNTDGTGRVKTADPEVSAFTIDGEWVYYLKSEDRSLHRMMLDGRDEEKLSEAEVASVITHEGTLYYVDVTEGGNTIWKMNPDGTSKVQLTTDKVTAMNVSGEWIYYGNTIKDSPDLELKRMKLDGSEVSVVNEDNPISINIHEDWLVYLDMDFASFSVKETLVRTDGTLRRDYVYVQPPVSTNLEKYAMKEKVKAEDFTLEVVSAYATNFIDNVQPGMESPIFDDVSDNTYIFSHLMVTNNTDKDLDLFQRIGVIEDIEAPSATIYWSLMTDITSEEKKEDIAFKVNREKFRESLVLSPKETKDIQLFNEFYEIRYPLYLGLFKPGDYTPLSAIAITPDEEYFVESFQSSLDLMKKRFPDAEVTQLNGMGYKFDGEEEEKFYYTFSVLEKGSSEATYYLVQRETGVIYKGFYDENAPESGAVPLEPVD